MLKKLLSVLLTAGIMLSCTAAITASADTAEAITFYYNDTVLATGTATTEWSTISSTINMPSDAAGQWNSIKIVSATGATFSVDNVSVVVQNDSTNLVNNGDCGGDSEGAYYWGTVNDKGSITVTTYEDNNSDTYITYNGDGTANTGFFQWNGLGAVWDSDNHGF